MSEEQNTRQQMTTAEFIKKFHEDIRDTADVQWREDKLWDSELVRNNRLLAKQTGEWISQGMPRNNIYQCILN